MHVCVCAAKVDAKNNDWLVCPSHSAHTVEIWQILPSYFRFGLISATRHRNCCGEFPNSLYINTQKILLKISHNVSAF